MTSAGTNVPRPVTSDVTAERLDGEVIAVHLGTGRYYSMSGPAADVWSLMEAGIAPEHWSRLLADAFAGGANAADVDAFVQQCLNATLVSMAPGAEAADWRLPNDYLRDTWVSPVLEEFEDLQDLILVDPVHDTSALGWPHIADADG